MKGKKLLVLLAAMTLALGAGLAYGDYPPPCPEKGSGLAGVNAWKSAYCGESACQNPATTCNNGFTIEYKGKVKEGNLLTFTYEVCRKDSAAGLSHWIFSSAGITCLGTNPETGQSYTLNDLVVRATIGGESITPVIGLDPTTQVTGIKFDTGFESGCVIYTITFDLSKLEAGWTLGEGCVLAATKAGNQDITRSDRNSPGYACIIGPVCVVEEQEEVCWQDETAWAAGSRYVKRGNWATYTPYEGTAKTVTLYAGQTMEAGTVAFSAPAGGKVTITVTLNSGWRFNPDKPENLKVQDYADAPSGNPAPGQFAWKKNCTDSTCSIEVPLNNYYGVHVDVQREVPCPEE